MNKLKAAILVGIAGSLPLIASAPAQAAPTCADVYRYAEIKVPGFECTVGDKTYYDFNLPNASNGFNYWTPALFIINSPIAEKHAFQVSKLAAAATPTQVTPITLNYGYKVKLDPMGAKFSSFTADATVTQQSDVMPPVAADWKGTLTGTKTMAGDLGTVTYMPGMPATSVMITPRYNGIIQFNGSITLNKNALLTQFTDTLSQTVVPGPLPVVGAAAAFGFSRRLRKRVKAMA